MIRFKNLSIFLFLTMALGVFMGTASAGFLKLLELMTYTREHHLIFIVFLPVAGVLTAAVYHKFGKNSQRGNNLIIDSVHRQAEVPFRMAVLTFLFTALSHLTGASVGREGTAVQIGGTFANSLSKHFKLDKKSHMILVMSGISAGFGSVFGTPLAGAFFGMEMCFVGKLSYEAIFPCFLASFTANYITQALGISHSVYEIKAIPPLGPYIIAIVILASCAFGFAGRLFAKSVHKLKQLYAGKIKRPVLRAAAGSLIVLAAMFAFQGIKYDGLSTWMISAGFDGNVNLFDPVLKFIMTVLSLGAGFQGGEATPLFDIGASLGGLIGQASHVEPSLLAALGYIAVFGCAANAPITTVMLGIELFGTNAMPYYVIAALVSYYASGHSGIYPAQVIAVSKYASLQDQVGQSLENIGNKNSTQ